jgi:hypothetical protein
MLLDGLINIISIALQLPIPILLQDRSILFFTLTHGEFFYILTRDPVRIRFGPWSAYGSAYKIK